MRRGFSCLLVVFGLVIGALAAGAVEPDEVLDSPKLEARARALSAELRCLVCQNQSIDDSNAPLARDLRLVVRERLVAGDSDSEVIEFLVSKYGEFVLLRPVWGPHTYLLWLAPLFALGLGVFLARGVFSPALQEGDIAAVKTEPLSDEEQSRLDRVLGDAVLDDEGERPTDGGNGAD